MSASYFPKGGTDILRAITAADGSFSFSNVPDATFTISSGSVSDPETRVTYRGASTQIIVSGTDVVDRCTRTAYPLKPL